MWYAFAALFAIAGVAGALAGWYRHKYSDIARDLILSRKSHGATIDELQAEHAAHIDARGRLEAVVRGKDLERARLEKQLNDHFAKCPDTAAAGEYIRSRLSLSTSTATPVSEYMPDPDSTQGGAGNKRGSS